MEDATSTESGDYWNDGKGWEPIGRNYATSFRGVFNGGGFSISNIHINRSEEDYVGLFGNGSYAEFIHVRIENANYKGKRYIGALSGYVFDGLISNSSATGSIEGDQDVGGLVGYHTGSSSITNSNADVEVTGGFDVGGLVGNNYGTTAVIESSYATGEVQGDKRVGGLAGNNRYEINNSYATGKVIGSDRIGGLVGNNRDGAKIYNSHATGDVEGVNNVGGLVGIATYGTVENCYASGDVSGTYRIGGLIGFTNGSGIHQRSYIINCFALGDVAGDERVGGLVGEVYSDSSITESYTLNQKLIRDNTDDTSFGRIFGERYADSITLNDNYANKDMTEPFEGAFNNKTPGSKDGGDLTSFSVDNGVLTVELTGSITGTVTDSETSPIEGATVSITIGDVEFQATTDTDGTYTMWNIPAGTNITVTANMDGYQPSSTDVTVEAGQQTGDVDFTLLDD